jgi:predicted  nucleic acid-binding Zn-ribbon protein
MPHQCVRCASELLEPLPARCPQCGLPVSRSLPPVEAQRAPSATINPHALAERDRPVVEQSSHSPAEQGSSRPPLAKSLLTVFYGR